jgi:hypothetical protein
MKKCYLSFLMAVLLDASLAHAQNTFPPSGPVGIGTSSPGYPLTVVGSAAIGDTVGSASEASNTPLLDRFLGTTADAAVNYVLLSYTNTNTGSFGTSGFDGKIDLYRGSRGSWNAASQYDVAVKDAYNGYSVMRFNSFGPLSGASVVTLTYAANSYVAVQIPYASSMDVYVTGRSWGFVPIVATGSQVSGVAQLSAPVISASSSNVGIDTSSPHRLLEVGPGIPATVDTANIRFAALGALGAADATGNALFLNMTNAPFSGQGEIGNYNYSNSTWDTLNIDAATIILENPNRVNGNVGIGTTNPLSLLSVGASSQFQVNSSGAVTSGSIISSGPVGIGMSPQYTLDVAGQIHASQAIYASGGVTFSDGSSLTSANTLCGGDYAESVDVVGNRAQYEPGDVLVLDTGSPGKFLKSTEPYSTVVAGIYSTKPGAIGRRQTTPKTPDEVPMAMVGIVPVKATAENGPIRVGDLLVSSSTPGLAMKGADRSRMLGAVIGKAMGSLDSGTGVIEILVTLQ